MPSDATFPAFPGLQVVTRPSVSMHWCFAAILVVALVARVAAGMRWQERLPPGQVFGFGDSEGYWELARGIAAGGQNSGGGRPKLMALAS